MMGNYTGTMDGAGWVLMILFWVTLIVAIAWMIMGMVTQSRRPDTAATARILACDSPTGMLKARLARGEIDIATYTELNTTINTVR
ncbi:hypothetical protein E3T55_19825 [Cryobacterium frigoriphilum]|uniref:SHOCT domain-containing protein n=1 Tax=Cryobacterium frigoriphilum TaxID=1259150 RepID=A0A4R8ZTB5_9MICO|nr:hypothetical protein [Cryobacterium frigoriphilum]TFD44813.1 hypothetical protein E3T55_19825 [Cryobacterium frigoriphilum]